MTQPERTLIVPTNVPTPIPGRRPPRHWLTLFTPPPVRRPRILRGFLVSLPFSLASLGLWVVLTYLLAYGTWLDCACCFVGANVASSLARSLYRAFRN